MASRAPAVIPAPAGVICGPDTKQGEGIRQHHNSSSRNSSSTLTSWCRAMLFKMPDNVLTRIGSC